MNAAIWKYELLSIADVVVLEMPTGAHVLHVECQFGMPMVWAQVDPLAPSAETRRFRIVGTGQDFDPEGLTFVATFQQGPFVWHLFEATA